MIQPLLFPLALLLALAAPAENINTTWWKNLAIHGYDPVAYFTEGKPMKGKAEFSTEWRGATWRFASEEHMKLFVENPEKYAPAYGGHCAWAVAQGDTADIDPEQWTLVDGRLFLNYNKEIQEKWLKDKTALIEQADKNWPEIKD